MSISLENKMVNRQAPWFYSSTLSESVSEVILTDDEARHVVAARRLDVGDAVCITNGQGLVACGVIDSVSNRPPRVSITLSERQLLPPGPRIHLASALPKGDRQKTMLDMATQAGLGTFTPLSCERSVASPGKNAGDRWRRVVIESSKQCRRAWLPEIRSELTLTDFLSTVSSTAEVFVASAEGVAPGTLPYQRGDHECVVLVGPEGGFSDIELLAIQKSGCSEIRLAPNVLRTETAAVLAVAVLNQLASAE